MKRRHLIIHSVVVALAAIGLLVAWPLGYLDFYDPIWLLALLGLPLFTLLGIRSISGLPSRTTALAATVRGVLFVILVACLADIQFVRTTDRLCVLFLLDHSASIPDEIIAQQLDYVREAAKTRGRKDVIGVLVFGENASVEVTPRLDFQVDHIYSAVNKDFTNLQGAVELAVAAFPSDARKKIVLITDGNENEGNLLDGVRYAVGNEVAVDVLPVKYSFKKEVLVESVQLPDKIRENEPFDLKVQVNSQQESDGVLRIYRNGQEILSQEVDLKEGSNTFSTTLQIEDAGFNTYTAKIESRGDTIRENNTASNYVYIQGESRILLVAPDYQEVKYLVEACKAENLEADVIRPEELPSGIEGVQNYDCIILANVRSEALTDTQMNMLRANTRDLGVGLIMIGGEDSFGAGGYAETPIEEALPVSMDIRQKKINPKGALVLILHTCEFADGNYWAKEITKAAIKTVNPQDEVGVVYYDYQGQDKWLFNLQAASNKPGMYNQIDNCEPGDMPSFAPAFSMSVKSLSESDAMVKHIICISDGDPASPKPSDITAMAEAGITVSTIGINPHSPRDVDLLMYIAKKTDGRFYNVEDPQSLPRIFTKEAKVVKRSLIFNESFQPTLVGSTELTKGLKPSDLPFLLAYVATTAKERAMVPIVSDNENHDPVLAHWQYGLGKSVAFTSDATNNWGKLWVGWEGYRKFWGQTIRWASRKRTKSNLNIQTQSDGARTKLIIDAIDKDGSFINFLKLSSRLVEPDNEGSTVEIRQTAPGRYEADFETAKTGVNILNIGFTDPRTGTQGFEAIGIAVPYSPEHRQLKTDRPLLQQAALLGGGKLLEGTPATDGVFQSTLPPNRASRSLLEALATVLIILLFLDIVMRRVIVSRNEVAAVWHAFLLRLPFSKRGGAGEKDATMAALLKRKQQVASGQADSSTDAGPVSPMIQPTGDFKERLAKRAESSTVSTPLEQAGDDAAGGTAAAGKPKPGPTKPTPPPEEEGGGYTNRLLQAKKRAREKKDKDEG